MKIGQLITSFLQGKASPTMTSITFSPYAEAATVESKTGYFNESPGATPGTNRGRVKTVGGRILRGINDALPYRLRPIKSKRRYRRKGYTLGVEIYTFRLVWNSHYRPRIKRWFQNKVLNKKVWPK
jgi:hypothetical protein